MNNTVLINPIYSAKDCKNSIEENMKKVGNNSGNLVFVNAIKEQLVISKEIWLNGEFEEIQNPVAIMPAANFIIYGSDDFILQCQKFLDKTKCSVTLAGLGAQLLNDIDTPKKLMDLLSPAKIYFLKNLSERCTSIGIRGGITAECLELIGIKNYRIIGCPSFYKYLDGVYRKVKTPSLGTTQMTITPKDEKQTKILEMAYKLKSIWLMQMMTEMPKSAFENETISSVWVERRFPRLELSISDFSYYLKNKTRLFFSIEDWDKYLNYEQISFAYGSRFHGNMEALRMGIPALWITHDSRTFELVEHLHLPHISIEQFCNLKEPEKLLEFCDYSDLYNNYQKLCREYVQFLDENNITHKFSIKDKV